MFVGALWRYLCINRDSSVTFEKIGKQKVGLFFENDVSFFREFTENKKFLLVCCEIKNNVGLSAA